MDVVLGDPATRQAAIESLGKIGTERAVSILGTRRGAAQRMDDAPLLQTAQAALHRANRYQAEIHFAQSTFAGLSASSILVLLALGLSIVFGLMDVINMAHGEFMMIGAFATFVVSGMFKNYAPRLVRLLSDRGNSRGISGRRRHRLHLRSPHHPPPVWPPARNAAGDVRGRDHPRANRCAADSATTSPSGRPDGWRAAGK